MSDADYLRGVRDGLTQAAEAVGRLRGVFAGVPREHTPWDDGADVALKGAVEMLRGTKVVEDYR